MATTFTWSIPDNGMQQWPSGTNAGYVVNVNFILTGTDGTNTASIQGNVQFPITQAQETFTPYQSLTEATVIGWVQESLGEQGVANFEANVQGQLNSLANPPVSPVSQPLPWTA